MDPEGIPERLRRARRLKDVSRAKAAQAIGVHEQTLAAWERGANDLPLLKAIAVCDYYAITINELIGDPSADRAVLDIAGIQRRVEVLEERFGERRPEDQ